MHSAWMLVFKASMMLFAAGLSLNLVCPIAISAADDFPVRSTLKFRQDHTFKIVAFGDVHWEINNDKNALTFKVMDTILEAEKPDLVIYTGDNCFGDTLDALKQGYRQMIEPVVRRNIPWVATLGNHDAEKGNYSRKEHHASILDMPGNLSSVGPKDIYGHSNFILPVMDTNGKRPAALLYMLDSNANYANDGLETYDWIHQNQIQWYRKASEYYRLENKGTFLPSYAFFHIPLPEFSLFYTKAATVGVKQEDVCCSAINSGFFSTILEHGGLKAMFCGHDHVNDYITEFGGVWLGYVRGVSYNAYGKEGYWKGSRVIELREGKTAFKTWLRLEDKKVVNVVNCE